MKATIAVLAGDDKLADVKVSRVMLNTVRPELLALHDFASNFQHWKPIRAGFVSKDLQCHGESISLRLMADAKLDTQLLKESLESRR